VNVSVHALLESYGIESVTDLNSSYNPLVYMDLIMSNTTLVSIVNSFNGTLWNGSYEILEPYPQGYWNATLNATADYMFVIFNESRLFFVEDIAPTHTQPILNSTTIQNYTNESLTVYNQSTFDIETDPEILEDRGRRRRACSFLKGCQKHNQLEERRKFNCSIKYAFRRWFKFIVYKRLFWISK